MKSDFFWAKLSGIDLHENVVNKGLDVSQTIWFTDSPIKCHFITENAVAKIVFYCFSVSIDRSLDWGESTNSRKVGVHKLR